MSKYITGFQTVDGIKQYDYNALANKPETGADFMIRVASGEVITMTDATNRALRSLNIYGKTTQNGTPTPETPVELVSAGDSVTVTVAGKNLVSDNWQQGMLAIEDGTTLTINNYWITNTDYIAVDSGKDYMFSADTANFACVFWYDKDKNFISYEQPLINQASKALVLPDYAKYARITYNYSKATEVITPAAMGTKHYVQLELGSTATNYQAYAATAAVVATVTEDGSRDGLRGIPVTFGGNYTDANGQQWVCDEIDFARGVYVKRINTYKLSPASAVSQTSGWLNKSAFTVGDALVDAVKVDDYTGVASIVSTHFKVSTPSLIAHNELGAIGQGGGEDIFFSVSGITDVASMQEWIAENTPTVQYILNTPRETPLSEEELAAYSALHTYRDNTTVSNDASAYMELEYVMDAKKYLDSLVASTILPATVE